MRIKQDKEVFFEGNSLEVLKGFPKGTREDLGVALRELQHGEVPADSRPMPSIDQGVFELKASDERTWYRVMYYTRIKNRIYVLHSFKKDSRKTQKRDLDIARQRLKTLKERIRNE